jgi:hypothetical protein
MIARSLVREALAVALLLAAVYLAWSPVAAQVQNTPPPRPGGRPQGGPVPRMPDGRPNLEGFWEIDPQINITAQLEEHPTGFGIRASPRVIDTPDGKIPYQPWALEERDRRRLHENAYEDPEGKCALAGVPHQMYVLFPVVLFLQPPGAFLTVFEYGHAYRHIDLTRTTHLPDRIRLWQGDSIGRWEGDTLVIDTTNLNGIHWLELYGDFIGPDAHVVERLTMRDSETIDYKATIDDPKTFTRPWSISYSYFRGQGYTELYEHNCHETNVDLIHMKVIYDKARGKETEK